MLSKKTGKFIVWALLILLVTGIAFGGVYTLYLTWFTHAIDGGLAWLVNGIATAIVLVIAAGAFIAKHMNIQ